LLASIVESSNDAIASADLTGIITSWNPAAERIFGYSADEAIGQSGSLLLPGESAVELALILEKISSGQSINQFESTWIRKDGHTFPVSLTASAIRDPTGAISGVTAVIRDITEQKRVEQYARMMASIVESSGDAILSSNLEGIITTCNPAAERLFGYSAEELVGESAALLVSPESVDEWADIIAKAGNGQSINQFEIVRIAKNGRVFPTTVTASPILDSAGEIIGITSITRDITEQKRMTRQLLEANELRNEFVAMVAHEIRSPATSISGFARVLIDQWNSLDEIKKIKYLKVIARNTEHLTKFVENVLQVARIEAGEFTTNTREFDICALAKRAILEAAGPDGVRRFQLTAPAEIPLVVGDEERQWQILMNLLSNAVKFSSADEPITVEISRNNHSVQVSVTDRGIGIAKDDQPRLFQKFGRLPVPGGRKVSGNGLGLYICKTLVEAQGGHIWCHSTPGQGSTFAYTIPVSA